MPAVNWDLVLKLAGTLIAVVGLIFAVKKYRHDRRPDRVEWNIDGDYVINVERDRAKWPRLFQQQNPTEGETGIFVRVTFRGRSSLKITALSFDWNMNHNFGTIQVTPITLNDGNSWEQLLFTRDVSMDQITAITVHAEGGRTFRQPINPDYRHRIKAHMGTENP